MSRPRQAAGGVGRCQASRSEADAETSTPHWRRPRHWHLQRHRKEERTRPQPGLRAGPGTTLRNTLLQLTVGHTGTPPCSALDRSTGPWCRRTNTHRPFHISPHTKDGFPSSLVPHALRPALAHSVTLLHANTHTVLRSSMDCCVSVLPSAGPVAANASESECSSSPYAEAAPPSNSRAPPAIRIV